MNSSSPSNVVGGVSKTEMKELVFEAARKGDIDILRDYISKKGDCNIANEYYRRSLLWIACNFGHYDLVKFLISVGSDLNQADKYGMTL